MCTDPLLPDVLTPPRPPPLQALQVCVDPLLPDVLRLPPGTDLHDHHMVLDGTLVLQV